MTRKKVDGIQKWLIDTAMWGTWIYALVQIFRLHLGFLSALVFTGAWFWLGEWYKKTQTECADDLTPEERCVLLECERDLLQAQNEILAGTVAKLSQREDRRLLLTGHLLHEIQTIAAAQCTVFAHLDPSSMGMVTLRVTWGSPSGAHVYSESFSAAVLGDAAHEDSFIVPFINRMNRAMRQSYERGAEA